MKPVAFDYVRAGDTEEALEVLHAFGEDAVVMAGGMSLGPMLNMRLVRPKVVVDIGRIGGLREVRPSRDGVTIGAAARQADVMADDNVLTTLPLLGLALPHVGHFQTRSRGTIGGSIAHADPSAEIPLALVTLDGRVELRSRNGRRDVAARAFFRGLLSTERRADELVTATVWPKPQAAAGYAFAEFAQRHGDFAVASAACAATLTADNRVGSLSLGLGGVEDRPMVTDTAGFLGEEASDELAQAIANHAGALVDPLEDMSASAEYRRALAVSLAAQVLNQAFAKAAEEAGR